MNGTAQRARNILPHLLLLRIVLQNRNHHRTQTGIHCGSGRGPDTGGSCSYTGCRCAADIRIPAGRRIVGRSEMPPFTVRTQSRPGGDRKLSHMNSMTTTSPSRAADNSVNEPDNDTWLHHSS